MDKANNDKKKVLIVSALGIVLVGVGAFSFMGSSAPAPTPPKEDQVAAQSDATQPTPTGENAAIQDPLKAQENQSLGAGQLYAQRDPFDPKPKKAEVKPDPNAQAAPPTAVAQNQKPSPTPPMDPMQGNIEPIPAVSPGNVNQQPVANVASDAPQGPSYRLTGVITGQRPMAVLESNDGKQRIVEVGDRINGRRVTAIRSGKVVLEDEGKGSDTQTLRLKEDAVKQQSSK